MDNEVKIHLENIMHAHFALLESYRDKANTNKEAEDCEKVMLLISDTITALQEVETDE